jgi:hypothetical protein
LIGCGGGMEYGAAIFAGIAASAIFWLIDKWSLTLTSSYQIGGMFACFVVFGGAGYLLTSRAARKPPGPAGTRIASGLRAKNMRVSVEGIKTAGQGSTDVLSDLRAKGDIDAAASNIETNR